jgi:hypothetical protein
MGGPVDGADWGGRAGCPVVEHQGHAIRTADPKVELPAIRETQLVHRSFPLSTRRREEKSQGSY